jgi:hypothetical protein
VFLARPAAARDELQRLSAERLPLLIPDRSGLSTIGIGVADDSYDYRITVELTDGKTMSAKFLSSTRFEEGQVITVHGRRCLVSEVRPDSQAASGGAQIVMLRCLAVDD